MNQSLATPDTTSRIQIAQWILDKQMGWIAAADSKVAVVIAIDTAIFAAIATAFAANRAPTAWAILLSAMAGALLVVALACAATSLFPRTDGPQKSLVFFVPIAKKKVVDYVVALSSTTLEELEADIAHQIHRNAEIAEIKHRWVRRSIGWSFLAALPWAAGVYLLVRP